MATLDDLKAEKQRRMAAQPAPQTAPSAPSAPMPQAQPAADQQPSEGPSLADLIAERDRRQATPQATVPSPPAAPAEGQADLHSGLPEGYEVIGTFADGGRVYRAPDGTMGATSAGGSTTDPAKVEALMKGDTFAQMGQQDFDNQRIDDNRMTARAGEVAQGLPFVGSYTDEALGAVLGDEKGDNIRSLHEAMQRERPKESAALNVAGGVLGAVPLAVAAAPAVAAAAPVSLMGQAVGGIAAGAVTGAAEGAVHGYGEGEGEQRKSNAGVGAAVGGATGLALGFAAPYATTAIRSVIARLKGADTTVIAAELGVSRRAARIVRDTLDTGTPEDAMAALERAGEGAMLADAGQPARSMLDAAAQAGGGAGQTAQNAVKRRTTAATGQMTEALDRTLGAPIGQGDLIDGIRSGSKTARTDAYDAAYAQPIDYAAPDGRKLEGLLKRVPEPVLRRAEQIMKLRGEKSPQIMATLSDDGSVVYERMPDVRQTHYIMQALSDVAKGTDGAGAFGRQNTYGSSVEGLRDSIGRNLKRAVPEFRAAQNVAADSVRQMEMTDLGYDLLLGTTRRDDVARSLTGISNAEKMAAQQGVRSYVDDVTANVKRTIGNPDTTTGEGIKILKDMSSRANERKLQLLLGDTEAADLLAKIDEATTAFELRAAITENSKTAARQSIQAGVKAEAAGGALQTAMGGEPIGATKRVIQAITGETPEAVRLREMGLFEDIARALTQKRGSDARRTLKVINDAMSGQPVNDAQARLIAQTVVGTGVLAVDRTSQTLLARPQRGK